MKRLLSVFLAICLALPISGCSASRQAVTLLDAEGNTLAAVTKNEIPDNQLENVKYKSYVKAAISEAAQALSQKLNCTFDEAEKELFIQGYTIHTAFDHTAFEAINKMYQSCAIPSVGSAIVAQDGRVAALYSTGETLCAIKKQAPYSAIKPLSVYAPAMEEGVIDWSTHFVDKPYKQITAEKGNKKDWPTNPTGGYTYAKTTLIECIRQSLNTTAVFCLKSLGVKKSLEFLKNSFDTDILFEQNKLALEGEEEIIGNVALGYLYSGVTTAELAGCYQIFSRGGKYIKPYTVLKITDKDGKDVYLHTPEEKQVISEETAYIMNRLLSYVTSPGGTGQAAKVEGTEVIGKTGTGTENVGNWFVGVTPEYSCSVWHGALDNTGNEAAELFSQIMKNMPQPTTAEFSKPKNIRKGVYCSISGKLFSPTCSRMQIGYYVQGKKPELCDAH